MEFFKPTIEGLRHARNLLQKRFEKERQRAESYRQERDRLREQLRRICPKCRQDLGCDD